MPICEIHLIYKYSFTSLFPSWMPFICFFFFFCQIALDRTLNIVLNRSGESGFCLLVPNLEGGELSVFTVKYDNSCGFLVDALYLVEEVPFYS